MLISVPLKTLPSVGRVPSYADNMLIMAKSEEDAVSMSTALFERLRSAPRRGTLRRPSKVNHARGSGFIFSDIACGLKGSSSRSFRARKMKPNLRSGLKLA